VHWLGQDIALEAPAPVLLAAQATLLELALRNLVDNALRHNPAGTYVEVRVACDASGQVTLSVSDDGGEFSPTSKLSPDIGLGIGLTLVERIAQSQGAQFVRDAGAAPFGKRFALVWPAAVQRSGHA
jgi:two-component system sensor histidine kinase QseC